MSANRVQEETSDGIVICFSPQIDLYVINVNESWSWPRRAILTFKLRVWVACMPYEHPVAVHWKHSDVWANNHALHLPYRQPAQEKKRVSVAKSKWGIESYDSSSRFVTKSGSSSAFIDTKPELGILIGVWLRRFGKKLAMSRRKTAVRTRASCW